MKFFLAKTEPSVYSIRNLQNDAKTTWDGVHNPQALRAIREMRPGDRVFIYHSTGESSLVGVAKVVSDPRPDPKDDKSWVVDLGYVATLPQPVTLAEVKQSGLFADFALVRQSRLSTMPCPDHFVDWVQAKFPKLKM